MNDGLESVSGCASVSYWTATTPLIASTFSTAEAGIRAATPP